MLRIPSFTFFHMREQWREELKEKLVADLLLSYAYQKGGRLKEILSFLETCCEKSYTQAQKETFEEYGACERCKGSGNSIIAYLAAHRCIDHPHFETIVSPYSTTRTCSL